MATKIKSLLFLLFFRLLYPLRLLHDELISSPSVSVVKLAINRLKQDTIVIKVLFLFAIVSVFLGPPSADPRPHGTVQHVLRRGVDLCGVGE